jgi:hypothetical protein
MDSGLDEYDASEVLRDMQQSMTDGEDEGDESEVDEESLGYSSPVIPGTAEQQYLQHGTASCPEIATPEYPLDFDRIQAQFSDDDVTPSRVAWCQKRFNQK